MAKRGPPPGTINNPEGINQYSKGPTNRPTRINSTLQRRLNYFDAIGKENLRAVRPLSGPTQRSVRMSKKRQLFLSEELKKTSNVLPGVTGTGKELLNAIARVSRKATSNPKSAFGKDIREQVFKGLDSLSNDSYSGISRTTHRGMTNATKEKALQSGFEAMENAYYRSGPLQRYSRKGKRDYTKKPGIWQSDRNFLKTIKT